MRQPELLLASQSPRRAELLRAAGVKFSIAVPDIDETPERGESAAALVRRLSQAKARAILSSQRIVLAADTVVAQGEKILGKPNNPRHAREMLRHLSGAWHKVYTGFCLSHPNGVERVRVVSTNVLFRPLTRNEIAEYVASGESLDKAGAYALQGEGVALVEKVRGSMTNVVGLPLAEVLKCLRELQQHR